MTACEKAQQRCTKSNAVCLDRHIYHDWSSGCLLYTSYVIEELITEKAEVLDKEAYYDSIVDTIIAVSYTHLGDLTRL